MLLSLWVSGLMLLSVRIQGSVDLLREEEEDNPSHPHPEGNRLAKRAPPTKWLRCFGKSKVKEEGKVPLLSEGGHAVFMVDTERQGGGERSQEVAAAGNDDTWEGQIKSLRTYQKHYRAVQRELAVLQYVPGVPFDHDTVEEEESAITEEVALFKEEHGLSEDGLLPDWSQMSLTQKHHGREYVAQVYGVMPSYFQGRESESRKDNRNDLLRERVKERRLIRQAESGLLERVPPLERGYTKDLLEEYRQEVDELQALVQQRDQLRQEEGGNGNHLDRIDDDISLIAYQAVKSIDFLRYKRDWLLQRESYLLNEIRRYGGEVGSTSNNEGTSRG